MTAQPMVLVMARPVLTRPDILAFADIAAIDQMVTRAMERRLPKGLGRAQFNILSRLAADGDQSPGDLADHLVLTRGAVTHLVGRLESQGLVAVKAAPGDSRRKRVRLTEAGVRALGEASASLKDLAASLRAALPAEGFERTLPLLRSLREHWRRV
jgi:DNA-binding MarR family transcriptional regulator